VRAAHVAGATAASRPIRVPIPTTTRPIPQSTATASRRGRSSGGQRAQRTADAAEQPAFEECCPDEGDIVGPERARHGELVLALRRASEQHRPQIHHQHEHQKCARDTEDEKSGTDAHNEVGFQSDGIELQPFTVEGTCVDDSADGIDSGGRRLR
jgi:hypothetical protein